MTAVLSTPKAWEELSLKPQQVPRFLEYAQVHQNGHLLLGASSLCGRTWTGSIWHYSDPKSAPCVSKSLSGVDIEASTSCGTWITDERIMIGTDMGSVEIWSSGELFELKLQAMEHHDSVNSLALFPSKKMAVSGSSDMCLKVWDIDEGRSVSTYSRHRNAINHIDCQKVDNNSLFASASRDGFVAGWDIRTNATTFSFDQPSEGCPTCVCWKPNSASYLYIGYESGAITRLDIRNPKDTHTWREHQRRVNKIAVNNSLMASCSDDCSICLFNVSENKQPEFVGKMKNHTDMVTDVCWSPTSQCQLVSCGWDHQVVVHNISSDFEVKS